MILEKRSLLYTSLAGLVIPLAYFLANAMSSSITNSVFRFRGAEEILLVTWPGSIFLIGTGQGTGYVPQVLSVISNVFYYAVIAWTILCLRRAFRRKARSK